MPPLVATHSSSSLRPYQQAAVAATLRHFRRSNEPACLVLPTGAGKSIIIAELARLARGKVLVLAHVKELCEQNHEKLTRRGVEAGLFAAGLGRKQLSFQVTFASIQSVHRNLERFEARYTLLIVDECHRLSNQQDTQYQQVIAHLSRSSPELKVLGLTATPYRLGMGWIYRKHYAGLIRTEEPRPFERCIHETSLRELVRAGYLAQPRLVDAPVAQYDYSALPTDGWGRVSSAALQPLLVQHGRVTQAIVQQVQHLAENRHGVMLFAATVDHAREVASYLPAEATTVILGSTPSAERDQAIVDFKARKLKYLVNVSVLTTGFDAPHVDLIAILRPTESVSLFQQMVGRGLRQSAGKSDCLIVDYAGSGFSVFHSEIGEPRPHGQSSPVAVVCPECGFENTFWGKQDKDGQVLEHYGRRCQALVAAPGGTSQCSFRFRFKECSQCGSPCDIAARRCPDCDAELIDPDDQLRAALGLKHARVLRVAGLSLTAHGEKLTVTYHDEDGDTLREHFDFSHTGQRAVFQRIFGRRAHAKGELRFTKIGDVLRVTLQHPDFVIARRVKRFWRIQSRIFDYSGRRRKAGML